MMYTYKSLHQIPVPEQVPVVVDGFVHLEEPRPGTDLVGHLGGGDEVKDVLGAVHILCQPKMGGARPLVRKNQKLVNPPSSEIIFCRTPINLIKPTLQEQISRFEIN